MTNNEVCPDHVNTHTSLCRPLHLQTSGGSAALCVCCARRAGTRQSVVRDLLAHVVLEMDLVGLELVLGVLRVVLLRGNTSALASPARACSDSATRATASGQRASARLEKRDDQIADGACDPLLGQRDLERLVERLRRRLLVVDEHLPRRRAVCRAREFTSRARNYTHLHRRRRPAKRLEGAGRLRISESRARRGGDARRGAR